MDSQNSNKSSDIKLTSTQSGETPVVDSSFAHLSFEQAMVELESIVKRLEEGRLPLDEAINFFERGSRLRFFCEQKLNSAKLRVEQIQLSPDGHITKTPFEQAP
jgi:exodeoxyribonuclease VII small subunit